MLSICLLALLPAVFSLTLPSCPLLNRTPPISQPSRVELHLHLSSSVRFQTIADLANAKNVQLTSNNTAVEIQNLLAIHRPRDLSFYLSKLRFFMPLLVGDLAAIERVAYELAEDEAKLGVAYFEARFNPYSLANTVKNPFLERPVPCDSAKAVTPAAVLEAVIRGLQRGMTAFGVAARLILQLNKGQPEWASEILQLAVDNRPIVVGIDLAGNVSTITGQEVAVFQRAKELGIHRTVHAAEMGPAEEVEFAINELAAERIGHGYHVLQNERIYALARSAGVHFEVCPVSSYLTGSVSPSERHPITVFAEDEVSFGVNQDDTALQGGRTLNDNYQLLAWLGLNELHFVRANLNAARASFLPENQKAMLVQYLYQVFGFEAETETNSTNTRIELLKHL